jgi:hypothetical protein
MNPQTPDDRVETPDRNLDGREGQPKPIANYRAGPNQNPTACDADAYETFRHSGKAAVKEGTQ